MYIPYIINLEQWVHMKTEFRSSIYHLKAGIFSSIKLVSTFFAIGSEGFSHFVIFHNVMIISFNGLEGEGVEAVHTLFQNYVRYIW